MMLLILAVLSNVLVAVVFKIFSKYKIDNLSAIVVNYFTCFTMSCILSGRFYIDGNLSSQPWFKYAFFIAILFIVAFNLIAQSVQKVGLSVTTVFQKLSLIFPVVLAILAYGEDASLNKIIGIALAAVCIILINYNPSNEKQKLNWLFVLPIVVWLSSGLIEMALFYVEEVGLVKNANIEFVGTLFLFAGLFGLPFTLYKRAGNPLHNFIAGIALGLPNFFSIYLILELLSSGWAGSVVFPVNNVSIIVVAGVIGFFAFKEKMTSYRLIGFIVGILAIYLIAK